MVKALRALACGAAGYGAAYLLVTWMPLPDSARSLLGALVCVGVTVLFLVVTDPSRMRGE